MQTLHRKVSTGLIAALAAAIFFAWLARAVMDGSLAWFDVAVRGFIHSWATPMLTFAMQSITQLGSFYVLVILGLIASWRLASRRRVRAAVILATSALGADAFDQLLKSIFRRP